MNNIFKKNNTEDLGFTYEIISGTTNQYGHIVNTVFTIDGNTLDMIDNVKLNTKYFKPSTTDWEFGLSKYNQLLISDVGRFVNYKIEKNGSNTILNSVRIREEHMIPTRENRELYKQYILNINKNTTKKPIKTSQLDEYPKYTGYTHFFVYRDPVDRFLSMSNLLVNNPYIGSPLNQKFTTKREIIDNCLFLCLLTESNVNPNSGEINLLSQSKNLIGVTKLDYMVNISDLSDFLLSKFGEKINEKDLVKNKTKTNSELHIDITDLTEDDIILIKKIFADDYDLYETYKNILWVKE